MKSVYEEYLEGKLERYVLCPIHEMEKIAKLQKSPKYVITELGVGVCPECACNCWAVYLEKEI